MDKKHNKRKQMFIETRGNDGILPKKVSFSQAVLSPSASFGGLYTPEKLPLLDDEFLKRAKDLDYKELSFKILKKFNIDIDDEVIENALSNYDKFDEKVALEIKKIDENLYSNELYHGPTRAFKDMALQPFGQILSHIAKEKNEQYLILVATSGDTGPATLETFKDKKNIKVVCMYPDGGTSDVQRLQMVTNNAENLLVLGVNGNFDDCQKTLKDLLNSAEFKQILKHKNIELSAANSVNFGRIIFQIIYHIYASLKLSKINEKIDICIPSGNFGNALGAYFAKKMGAKIDKIYIASNINNILYELFTTGIYDIRDKKLQLTTSPAMDILISSNVERLLFDKFGANRTKELMDNLNKNKYYKLANDELKTLQEDFTAVFSDDEFAKKTILKYAKKGYILDPHTATCLKVLEICNLKKPLIICSTAEWTKFAPTMLQAINENDKKVSDKEALKEISSKLKLEIPNSINELFLKPIKHNLVVNSSQVIEKIREFL